MIGTRLDLRLYTGLVGKCVPMRQVMINVVLVLIHMYVRDSFRKISKGGGGKSTSEDNLGGGGGGGAYRSSGQYSIWKGYNSQGGANAPPPPPP